MSISKFAVPGPLGPHMSLQRVNTSEVKIKPVSEKSIAFILKSNLKS